MLGLGWARPAAATGCFHFPSIQAGGRRRRRPRQWQGRQGRAGGRVPSHEVPSIVLRPIRPPRSASATTNAMRAPPGRNRRAAGSANTHSSVSSPMAWGSRACPSHDTTLPTITTSSPWPLPSPPVVRHFCSIAPGTRSPAEAQQRSLSRRHLLRQRPLPTALCRGPLFASAHLKGAVQFSASQSLPTVTCGMYVLRTSYTQGPGASPKGNLPRYSGIVPQRCSPPALCTTRRHRPPASLTHTYRTLYVGSNWSTYVEPQPRTPPGQEGCRVSIKVSSTPPGRRPVAPDRITRERETARHSETAEKIQRALILSLVNQLSRTKKERHRLV